MFQYPQLKHWVHLVCTHLVTWHSRERHFLLTTEEVSVVWAAGSERAVVELKGKLMALPSYDC